MDERLDAHAAVVRRGSYPRHRIPRRWRDWLLDATSLTRRLQRHCDGRFHVQLLHQGYLRPRPDEAQRLGMRGRVWALERQVVLCCGETPLVLAHSVIPPQALRGPLRRLRSLGERPLGAFLFAQPGLQRSAFEIIRVLPGPRAGAWLSAAGYPQWTRSPLWGRRSRFRIGSGSLLVSELFLPELLAE